MNEQFSMYTRYVSLIIIWKTNKEEQPRQKSIVVGYFWCFLSHRIVIISYYQTCNGFLVQCICMACVVKMINYECMFLQTDIISAFCSFILGFVYDFQISLWRILKTILSLHHLKFIWRVVKDELLCWFN